MTDLSLIIGDPVKSLISNESVIPAPYHVRGKLQPESGNSKKYWTPAFAGVTLGATFCETIKFGLSEWRFF